MIKNWLTRFQTPMQTPYADDASNNELENLNTKSVKPGQTLYYQVWFDTTQFDANNKDHIQTVGITDDFDETKLGSRCISNQGLRFSNW